MNLSAEIDQTVLAAIAGKTIVGAVIAVSQHGQEMHFAAYGHLDREAGIPMRPDAIFRLASVTKPIVAATALAMIDKGLLHFDDTIETHLPYFRPPTHDGDRPPITIHQLLTHTAGLDYTYPDPMISGGIGATDLDFEANFTRVAAQPMAYRPGTQWRYSVALDVLGAAIARIEGTSLHDAMHKHIGGPLGMTDTGFHVTDPTRLAVPYGDATPEPARMADPHTVTNTERGATTFSPSRIFNPRAFQSGGAGMVGTASDLMTFFEAIRRSDTAILSKAIVKSAVTNQIGDLPRDDAGMRFGYLGAILADPAAADSPCAVGSINWGGIYGHSWFIDPENGLSVVMLTNTAIEGCNGRFPDDVRNAIYRQLPSRA